MRYSCGGVLVLTLMRYAFFGLLVFLLVGTVPIRAHQALAASPQGAKVLLQSLRSMAGTPSINDVTLIGTARRIVGSDDETGSVVLKALTTGQSLVKFAGASGQLTEVVSISSAGQPAGSWAGPDGTVHAIAQHNLRTDSSWFFPALTLGKLLASPATGATLVGQETRNEISVTHLSVHQQVSGVPSQLVAQFQALSEMDIYLDAATLLPVALDFATHPDNNILLNIPVEIQFSDYRSVNGVQVPFHIQKYLNNSLLLDIQVETATVNSGLTATAFTIQ